MNDGDLVGDLIVGFIELILYIIGIVVVGGAMALCSLVRGAYRIARGIVHGPAIRRELARVRLEQLRAQREVEAIAARARWEIRQIGAAGQHGVPGQELQR
jgi:hypothetical protein